MSKDPDNVVRIDVDIMLSYVRDLYDAILSDPAVSALQEAPAKKPVAVKAPEPIAEVPHAPAPPPVRETPPAAPPPPPPAPPPPPVPPVKEVKPEPEPIPAPVMEQAPTYAPPTHGSWPPEAEALFEEKQAKELSEKLSELPIADLRRSIALNDRLLLTRELFSGDGQAFEAAILALNGFRHFDEARVYLLDQCVIRYGWLDKQRVEASKNFIKLVRRRYK